MLDPSTVPNVARFEEAARKALHPDVFAYLAGGADDMVTLSRNTSAFREIQIRARRLVDVSNVDTSVTLFGVRHESPILLSPVAFQSRFHADAELATARAAAARGHGMILSSLAGHTAAEVAAAGGRPVWFQLYPTPDRAITCGLLERAESAGCPVVVLTVDTPVFGNRETHGDELSLMIGSTSIRRANYEGLGEFSSPLDPSMTWDMIAWLRAHCGMRILLKGIVTAEDAELAIEHGADGVIVSNHGGRQEESGRATIECLPEVVAAVNGRMPVLIDGGFRRGTDVFKALALGADAVCIGRPYAWGLAAGGQPGVERVLEILREEFVRILQLSGVPSVARLDRSRVV